ncbi:MAG: hypothetical protein RMJ56_12065 [Gemmataceae bacterium]|nr:hypothetical protein [Gemmata sp.]MDW8198327.1 hypothetical protein [Gemmataceae bacterium]
MAVRRCLLSWVILLVTIGGGAGKPPGLTVHRIAEWRELDPVARDYYLNEPQPPGEAVAEAGTFLSTRGGLFLLAVYEEILARMTIPLGTVPMNPTR